jgi:VanZ family protein
VIVAIGRVHISFKVLHFCAYTSLALIALVAVRRRSAAVLAALAMILLGVALEFGQKLVPGRSCEIRDMFINGVGVLTGIAIGIPSRRIASAARRS